MDILIFQPLILRKTVVKFKPHCVYQPFLENHEFK